MTVNSYTPEKQSPSFSGPINQLTPPTTDATAGNVTYTAAQILSGIILRDTSSSARADVFPAAASIVPKIEGAQVGSALRFLLRNTSVGAGSITLTAGTGTTIKGKTNVIAYLTQEEFILVVTALGDSNGMGATCDIYTMGYATF